MTKKRPDPNTKYRLVTRSDMDGLVCAVLLKKPKDMQDGTVDLTDKDITTNLPYNKEVFLCIDHHSSELKRVGEDADNLIIDTKAKSAQKNSLTLM